MTEEQKCPIWGTPCEIESLSPKEDVWYVDSPRAGGRYRITGSAKPILEGKIESGECTDQEKVKISRWIYEQNQLGEIPEIATGIVRKAAQWPMPSVPDRIDALLQCIESKTRGRIGMRLKRSDDMKAATSSLSYEDFGYLVHEAKNIDWLDDNWMDSTLMGLMIITLKGHMRLEELRSKQVLSEQAFVAMWFDKGMAPVWEQGFKPGIEDAGYKPMRIDQKQHINKIDDEIIAEIRRSRFLVADFTAEPEKPRGGVYYEAGFAHGLNIPVIFTCRADRIDDLHFDTRQFNHIAWEEKNPGDLRKQLKNRISATLGDGPLLRRSQAAAKSQSGN